MNMLRKFEGFVNAPFLNLAFRPFFFAAGLSSVLLMLLWFDAYQTGVMAVQTMSAQVWHAHEMIFAYLAAVIVGFLLTAIQNWTGKQMLNGAPLLLLFLLWLLARLLPFIDGTSLWLQAIVDCSFLVFAFLAMLIPIVKAKAWKQMGVLSKIFLLLLAHVVFYLGLLGVLEQGVKWGLYGAFYMIMALTFVLARRVMPFFIEKGLGNVSKPANFKIVDVASLVLLVCYVVLELFWPSDIVYAIAGLLCALHGTRLVFWYRHGIWKKPLLWSLYLAYIFLVLGFALKTAAYFTFLSPFIIFHCFAIGVAFFTLAMMSRVSLGHTGRKVSDPPAVLKWAFVLMVLVFVFRIILPLVLPLEYVLWIQISQVLWIVTFSIFISTYAPMLFKSRLDGKPG